MRSTTSASERLADEGAAPLHPALRVLVAAALVGVGALLGVGALELVTFALRGPLPRLALVGGVALCWGVAAAGLVVVREALAALAAAA